MTEVPSQIPVWEAKHGSGNHEPLRHKPSPFAQLAEPYFARQSHILELGCGVGRDAEFFVSRGHTVLATDGVAVVIEQNRQSNTVPGVEFAVLDMREPWPYKAASFDVVYANLSLHYYSDEVTGQIVRAARRVVKPGGWLAFACKSDDTLHRGGREIAPDIFASPSGQTIHLFSQQYMRELVEPVAAVEYLDEIEEVYSGRESKIVRCLGRAN
ncbi:MAG TPA: class I SAM-dependent methyltransferase [Candidatus Saccharimonadales bacterium]